MNHETQENIHAETFGKFLSKAARSQLLYVFMSLQWSVLPMPEGHLGSRTAYTQGPTLGTTV